MKFNVIIGNPPYNKDLYIDIIKSSYKNYSEHMIFITPSRWEAKVDVTGYLNEWFRTTLVPKISRVVKYRASTEVFDTILCADGITYYLITNEKVDNKKIKFICKGNSEFNTDWEEHVEKPLILIPNKLLALLNKISSTSIADNLGFKRCVYVNDYYKPHKTKLYEDDVVARGIKEAVGYARYDDLYTHDGVYEYKIVQTCMPGCNMSKFSADGKTLGSNMYFIMNPGEIPLGGYKVVKTSKNIDELKSLQSYLGTKLMSLAYYLGICGVQLNANFYRFVPDIEDYSLIYTDEVPKGIECDADGIYYNSNGVKCCSLYKKYKLTTDEIGMIDNIIRGRTYE